MDKAAKVPDQQVSMMKPNKTNRKDTMQDEYDMRSGVRGKYTNRFPKDVVMVALDPDVSTAFPDAASVNELSASCLRRKESRPSGLIVANRRQS